jgi:hypothetical protein
MDDALNTQIESGDAAKLAAKGCQSAGTGGEKLTVTSGERRAEVHVIDADRLGVRVRGVRVCRGIAIDVAAEAAALPARTRSIPDPLVQTEVDPGMEYAVLRTDPDQIRHCEFFEVGVYGNGEVDVRRMKVADNGDRERIDWTLSREQLGRLLDELATQSP